MAEPLFSSVHRVWGLLPWQVPEILWTKTPNSHVHDEVREHGPTSFWIWLKLSQGWNRYPSRGGSARRSEHSAFGPAKFFWPPPLPADPTHHQMVIS